MKNDDLKLVAFPIGAGVEKNSFKPAERLQPWQLATDQAMATRCLPLNIANCHGWQAFCPGGFDAVWDGGNGVEAIDIIPHGNGPVVGQSHFGYGVLTFMMGVLFRTSPGHNLMIQGPINDPKDGIQGLSGIIETDWSPYSLTMNWKFTRPGRVSFKKGEAFAQFFPIPRGYIESFDAEFRNFAKDEPEGEKDFVAWRESRLLFNKKLGEQDPETVNKKWQKLYFRGMYPDEKRKKDDHQTKLMLSPFTDKSEFDFASAMKIYEQTKFPISACLVCRNEASSIQGYLDNIAPHVTEVLILDLGSVDGTVDIIKNSNFNNIKLVEQALFEAGQTTQEFLAKQAEENILLFLQPEDRVLDDFWTEVPVYLNRLENEVATILNPLFIGLFENELGLNILKLNVDTQFDIFIPTGACRPTLCKKDAILTSNKGQEKESLTAEVNIYSMFSQGHKIRNPEYVLRKMFFEEKMGQPMDQATLEALSVNFTDDQLEAMRQDSHTSTLPLPHDHWWGIANKT